MSSPRIAVVGGGLAGISSALRAADGGAQVVLLERRSMLGGLTWSFRRRGLWFDNGQHVHMRCCTAYRGFLDRIGAANQVVLQPRLDVPVLAPGAKRASITRSDLPAPLHLAGAMARYRHLSPKERARMLRPVLALRRLDPADPALDKVTFGQWLADQGQSRRAIDHLWNLIALPTLNVVAEEASLALAVKVFRTGLLDEANGADIGWSQVPLRQLHGENATRALADAGVEVRLGARVEQVAPRVGGGWEVSMPDGGLAADAVVVATPPAVTAAILPTKVRPEVEGLGTSPIVNVHLVLDRRVTDLAMAACVGSPIQFIFDRTESSGLTAGQCLVVSLSAADRYIGRRPDDLVRSFRDALDQLFPSARPAVLVDGTVTRERAATFRGVPGTASLRPAARTSLAGLTLAGAWCDTGWPATMESAVRSGMSAASELLRQALDGEFERASGLQGVRQ